MFGRKSAGRIGEIDVADFDFLDGASEFARLWNGGEENGLTAIIEPRGLGADPGLFGLALMDAARHGAKAYAQAVRIPEDEALERILEFFDAERADPTDQPRQIDPDTGGPGQPH